MKKYEDGEACSHPGCLNHVSHPCEECGRIMGRGMTVEFHKSIVRIHNDRPMADIVVDTACAVVKRKNLSYQVLDSDDALMRMLIANPGLVDQFTQLIRRAYLQGVYEGKEQNMADTLSGIEQILGVNFEGIKRKS